MAPVISFLEFVGVGAGVAFACIQNFFARKPMQTGIYKHAAYAVIGYYAGNKVECWKEQKEREYIQILEDYRAHHPEDFIEPQPQRYADVLLKWYPVR